VRTAGAQIALAALSLLTNVLGYGFTVVMSRALPVERFGELAALVGVIVTTSVAGTAWQAVVARRVASGERPAPAQVLSDTLVVAVVVGVVVAVAVPLLRPLLAVDGWSALLWLALSMVPTTFAYGLQGIVQGENRLVRLGFLLAAIQAAKFLAGLVAALTGGSIPLAFALTAAFTAVAVVVATPFAAPVGFGRPTFTRPLVTAFLRDIGALLGVLLLTTLDLVLARRFLDGTGSGLYAAGNVLTRGAFWAPTFIALAGYPKFSDPATRPRALRQAGATWAVMAAGAVLFGWLGRDLVPLVLGSQYRDVTPQLWLFAAQGAALAGLQLCVYAGLAVHDRRPAVLLWALAVVEVVAVATVGHGSVAGLVATVAICSWVTLLLTVAVLVRWPRHRAPVGTRVDTVDVPTGAET
jgi:O-antigen/teichoic acid export membrane protein